MKCNATSWWCPIIIIILTFTSWYTFLFLPVVPIDDSFLMTLTRTRSNYGNFMSGSCLITKSFMTEDSYENSSLTRTFYEHKRYANLGHIELLEI